MKSNIRKQINGAVIFFTALIVVYEIVSLIAVKTDILNGISIKENIIISQSLIFVPTVIYLIICRQNPFELLRIKRFHPLCLLLLPILVFCMEPVIIFVNALSMAFVKNYISDLSTGLVTNNTLGSSLFYMAVIPCIVEELAYRGIILGTFRKAGRLKAVIIAGCLFGIMHMNFNQMAYAILIGIVLGFLAEAVGSIIPGMIVHFLINGVSVVLSYIVAKMPALSDAAESTISTRADYLAAAGSYFPFAAAGFVFSILLIYAMAALNNREKEFMSMFKGETDTGEKCRIMTPLLIITIVYCIAKCIYDEFIL